MPGRDQDKAEKRTVPALLGLGASLGDRARNLRTALARLEAQGITIREVSPVYESPHLGLTEGDDELFPPHLNAVAQIETTLSPEALLDTVQAVERAGGRERLQRWGPRTIDIDILDYDNQEIATARLNLPHPGIASRAFVARPLLDLQPEFKLKNGSLLRDRMAGEAGPTSSLHSQTPNEFVSGGQAAAGHTAKEFIPSHNPASEPLCSQRIVKTSVDIRQSIAAGQSSLAGSRQL